MADGTANGTSVAVSIKNNGSEIVSGNVSTTKPGDAVIAHFIAGIADGTTLTSATVQLDSRTALSIVASKEFSANKFYNVARTQVPTGAIGGKFTINSNGDKVYFSKGNLQAKIATYSSEVATASEWKFADSQYSYIGNAAGNNSFAVDSWVDLFSWVGNSASNDTYGLITFTSRTQQNHGNTSGESLKTDWGTAAASSIGSGWRTRW